MECFCDVTHDGSVEQKCVYCLTDGTRRQEASVDVFYIHVE